MTKYPYGQTITLTSPVFKDDSGAILPVREITFNLRHPGPDGAFEERTPDHGLDRRGLRYTTVIQPRQAGTWTYRWLAETRAGTQVDEGRFVVGRDRFVSKD